jgi:hypothetical protein
MTNHPSTPPPELVQQWKAELPAGVYDGYKYPQRETELCIQAAQWGADQELEACKQFMHDQDWFMSPTLRMAQLHTARRPKPPSLKEQALAALHAVATGANDIREQHQDLDTIRRALEQLND